MSCEDGCHRNVHRRATCERSWKPHQLHIPGTHPRVPRRSVQCGVSSVTPGYNAFVPRQSRTCRAMAASTDRSRRVLYFCSFAMLGVGALLLLLHFDTLWGILLVSNGLSGVFGLGCSWHRALQLFMLLSWVTTATSLIKLIVYGTNGESNPIPWIEWLLCGLTATTASVLSSSLMLLRVWRPAVGASDQRAPLVDPTEDLPPPAAPAPTPSNKPPSSVTRPVWPPPEAPPAWPPQSSATPSWPPPANATLSGANLMSSARVANAVHTGDASGVSANDVVAAARVGASVWPPPQPGR